MARSLSSALTLNHHLSPKYPSAFTATSRLLALRTQSSHSSSRSNHLADLSDLSDSSSSSDPFLRRLEDAIHRIIVRRSAPDWLPFVPGASYWVPPPRSQLHGVAQLVEKLSNPLNQDQSLSTTTVRGWPSSAYFIHGAPPHPLEAESNTNEEPHSDDEEQ